MAGDARARSLPRDGDALMVEIIGHAPARFDAVKDAFAANFEDGGELGCRFTLVEAGEVVVAIERRSRGADLP